MPRRTRYGTIGRSRMAEPEHQPQTTEDKPALSIIIAAGGQRERAARALRSLLDQSAIDRMEILLFDLGPTDCPAIPGSDHPRVKAERSGPNDLLVKARIRGVYAATSPVVCFMEEHCEMHTGWAEAVISAHRDSWAGVGTDFVNGNPGAGQSDKAFRMNYGIYVRPPAPRGPVPLVAGQNSAFKRDILLSYEPHLELMLNADLVLQWKMQQDGYRMFYEPSVTMAHKNENTFRSLAVGVFYWNWCFSNVRAHMFEWNWVRRAIWIALAPLIPWVRVAKTSRRALATGFGPFVQFLRDVPFIFAISYFGAAGQVAGLLNRIDRGVRKFSHFEMNEPRLSREELLR